jgi:cell division transport system permease protein
MRAFRFAVEVCRAALLDVRRRPLASGLAVAALAVAVFVLGAFVTVSRGVEGVISELKDQAVVELYLERDADPEAFERLADDLRDRPEVRRVEYLSPERALEEFRSAFPDLAEIEQLIGENPFPASLRVVPRRLSATELEQLVEQMRTREAVSSVGYDREWIEGLSRAGRDLAWFVLAGVVVLVAAALVSLGSVVRLALDDKREEVVVMRLVGAPTTFVVAPIFAAGALLGAAGGAVGLAGAEVGRRLALDGAQGGPVEGLATMMLGRPLTPGLVVTLVVATALAGAVAAGVSGARAALR